MSFLAQPTSRPIKSESWRGAQAEHSVTRPGEQKPAKDGCSRRWGDLVPGKWQVTMLCQVHSACRCWVCKASHFLPPPICIHISIPHLTGNVIIPQTEAADLSGHLLSLNLLICSGMFWFFFQTCSCQAEATRVGRRTETQQRNYYICIFSFINKTLRAKEYAQCMPPPGTDGTLIFQSVIFIHYPLWSQ